LRRETLRARGAGVEDRSAGHPASVGGGWSGCGAENLPRSIACRTQLRRLHLRCVRQVSGLPHGGRPALRQDPATLRCSHAAKEGQGMWKVIGVVTRSLGE
jgi:hypothetical protein